jgi:hypothetical protein
MSIRTHIAVFICICISGLVGCAVPQAELADADYGTYPTNYESRIRNYFEMSLIDPESARYRFGEPYKGAVYKGLVNGGGWQFGYGVDCTVNAKNRMGGYTGQQPHTFFFYGNDMMTRLITTDQIKRID